MKCIGSFIDAILLLILLGLGVAIGCVVTTGYKDREIAKIQAQLDIANAELEHAEKEKGFWQGTLRGLAEGNQLAGIDLKGRPSQGD